jgi:hypothetical protein
MVGPTLEEMNMDGQTNQAQEVPGVLVDTGPTPLDVLEARMTLAERVLLDRERVLRQNLQEMTAEGSPAHLAQLTESLRLVEARLQQLRQMRSDW